MWSHARLLRRAVLLVSLLTLSGLHVQQQRPAAGWRAVRLLPLSVGAAHVSGILAFTLTTRSLLSSLYSIMMLVLVLFSLLLMVHLLRRRRELHVLLERVAELDEATAHCRRPGDYRFIQWQSLVLPGVQLLASAIWVGDFLSGGEFEHPHYVVPALVPPALRGPRGYWLVVAFQVLASNWLFGFSVLFNLVLIGLTDASTLLVARLTRLSGLWLDAGWDREHTADGSQKAAWSADDRDWPEWDPPGLGEAAASEDSPAAVRVTVLARSGARSVRRLGGCACGLCADRPAAAEPCRLQQLRRLYGQVAELTAAGAELCSLPTLGLHGLVTTALLVGLYVNVQLFRGGAGLVRAVSYALFLLLSVLQLVLVSVSGSRLADRGQQLHAALTTVRWAGRVTPEAQLALQLLLAHTRQPIGFDGWGLFTTHKTTMQSLLGFVLTYFIIMIQLHSPTNTGPGLMDTELPDQHDMA